MNTQYQVLTEIREEIQAVNRVIENCVESGIFDHLNGLYNLLDLKIHSLENQKQVLRDMIQLERDEYREQQKALEDYDNALAAYQADGGSQ